MTDTTAQAAPTTGHATTPMRTVVAASAAGHRVRVVRLLHLRQPADDHRQDLLRPAVGPTAGQIAALALFGVGFAFRPLGALIFGRVGDVLGRKAAFLICVSMMGGATFAIGLLPSYQQIGPDRAACC